MRLFILFVSVGVLWGNVVAQAATITVNSTQAQSSATLCTLADAIKAANNNAAYGACAAGDDNGDVIELQANQTYTLPPPAMGFTSLPIILSEITFNGNGARIKGTGTPEKPFRLLGVGGSNIQVTFSDIIFSHGYDSQYDGGAIAATQTGSILRFNRCSFLYNTAKFGGAVSGKTVIAYDSAFYGNNATGQGGAIYADNLILLNSTLTGNMADTEGSAIYMPKEGGTATIVNTTISTNGSKDTGAPLAGKGEISLQNSIVAKNVSIGNNSLVSCHVEAGGKVVTRNHNIITPVTCTIYNESGHNVSAKGADQDLFNQDPGLGNVVNENVAGRYYVPLQDGSIAVDHGPLSACGSAVMVGLYKFDLSLDQLGNSRVQTCDTGAIEAICGDGIIHSIHHESCDGSNLGGAGCASFLEVSEAFGELTCSTTCQLAAGSCSTQPPVPPSEDIKDGPPAPQPPTDAEPKTSDDSDLAGPSGVAVVPGETEEAFGKDNPFVGQAPTEEKPQPGTQEFGSLSDEKTDTETAQVPTPEPAPAGATGGGGCSLIRQ